MKLANTVTVNSATLSWSKRLGAKKAKKERIREVKASSGVRYKTTALDRPAIMIRMKIDRGRVENVYRKECKARLAA